MEIRIFKQVGKILERETLEIREDLQDILEKIELGLNVGMPHIRSLNSIYSGLSEIRVKDRTGQFRVIIFMKKGDAIYLIHAFRKKTEKLAGKDIAIILKRLREIKNE